MASDWIKMRVDLYRDPKVIIMADLLMDRDSELARYVNQHAQRDMTVTRNVTRNAVVGALVSVWGVARVQGKRVGDDLHLDGKLPVIDDIADMQGFGEVMAEVGWAKETASGVVLPRFFAEHNADYDEQKQKNRERQARFRERQRNAERNGKRNVTSVTRNAPRGEVEIELNPSIQAAAVFSTLERWKGGTLTVSEIDRANRFIVSLEGQAQPEIHGSVVPWEELVNRAVSEAIECQTSFGTMSGAEKYLRSIIERCMRDGVWPGEFHERANGRTGGGNHRSKADIEREQRRSREFPYPDSRRAKVINPADL